ncbi:hypothetical protein L602_001000001100 [Cupriavidus gilardii J11]|uniref:Fusaric acid resistance family protein n=1 Tax=Cupriavidus gilardii J11 TaxID=936133 RepID=A0A562BUJ5_9BURK|nr:hypothetical protein L602_001000001100 [Cupriavidus gilardii J11]
MLPLEGQLGWIRYGYIPLSIHLYLLQSARQHPSPAGKASRIFHAVLDSLAQRAPGIEDTIGRHEALVVSLRTTLSSQTALIRDEKAWIRTLGLIDKLKSTLPRRMVANDTAVLDQQRVITLQALRMFAPSIEARVRAAVGASIP